MPIMLSELAFNPVVPVFSVDALQSYHHDAYISYLKSKIGYQKVEVVPFVYTIPDPVMELINLFSLTTWVTAP